MERVTRWKKIIAMLTIIAFLCPSAALAASKEASGKKTQSSVKVQVKNKLANYCVGKDSRDYDKNNKNWNYYYQQWKAKYAKDNKAGQDDQNKKEQGKKNDKNKANKYCKDDKNKQNKGGKVNNDKKNKDYRNNNKSCGYDSKYSYWYCKIKDSKDNKTCKDNKDNKNKKTCDKDYGRKPSAKNIYTKYCSSKASSSFFKGLKLISYWKCDLRAK